MNNKYTQQAVGLLRQLVAIQSFSGEEHSRANFLSDFFAKKNIPIHRTENNLIIKQQTFDASKPTCMLNSHLDTVRPTSGYTFDPFRPPISDTHVYGLGSNDAGASVVSMISTFLQIYDASLPFNIVLVLSSEEENSGPNGMRKVWNTIANDIDFAIIGEPTGMRAAIAERGLLVIDGEAKGVSGHAARNEGVNAINIALEDLRRLKSVAFDKISPTMGSVKLSVTQIQAGTQHNVIPDSCKFVLDIRPTEQYSNQEIMNILQPVAKSILKARSLTNKSSATLSNHLLIKAIDALRIEKYTSPTTSDWMRITCPAIKMGPGESARSHQADEFVLVEEIAQGISSYVKLINKLAEISPDL